MRKRCRADKPKYRHYADCTISDNFKDFQYFADWCNKQIGFKCVDSRGRHWNLEKDILAGSSKEYSENVCVFVPDALNKFLLDGRAIRGEYPIGVDFDPRYQTFRSRCSNGFGQSEYLGSYKTVESAFKAYKEFKESLAAKLAVFYSDCVDPRVCHALLNYKVKLDE